MHSLTPHKPEVVLLTWDPSTQEIDTDQKFKVIFLTQQVPEQAILHQEEEEVTMAHGYTQNYIGFLSVLLQISQHSFIPK